MTLETGNPLQILEVTSKIIIQTAYLNLKCCCTKLSILKGLNSTSGDSSCLNDTDIATSDCPLGKLPHGIFLSPLRTQQGKVDKRYRYYGTLSGDKYNLNLVKFENSGPE